MLQCPFLVQNLIDQHLSFQHIRKSKQPTPTPFYPEVQMNYWQDKLVPSNQPVLAGCLQKYYKNQQDEVLKREKIRPLFRVKQWSNNLKDEENENIKYHIYNFFLTQGHADLAEQFAKQSSLKVSIIQDENLQKRAMIKHLIINNQFEEAAREIKLFEKDRNVKVLEEVLFMVNGLKVIQYIKEVKLQQAIDTAKSQLIPFAKTNFQRIKTIQKIMSLIAYTDLTKSKNQQLLQANYKAKVADEVNSSLLAQQQKQSLKHLLNLGKWFEKRLEAYCCAPHFSPFGNEVLYMRNNQ